MEVGNRDSDAEVDGLQKKKETEYDPDGRLKLEVERDSVKLQLQNLLVDMKESLRRLVWAEKGARVGAEEGTSVEIRRELQLEAKRRLAEFEELLWRRKKEKKKKEKRRVNSGGREEGRVVQQLLRTLNQVAGEISRQLMEYEDLGGSKDGGSKATIEVDLAMGNSVEGLKGGRSRKGKEAKKARKIQKGLEKYEEWKRKKDEEDRHRDPEELTDHYAYEARLFEKRWYMIYSTGHGRFEDNTSIPCKRFTVNPPPRGGFTRGTLQVFSVKVTRLTGGLQWPLNVFGLVALRDSLDYNRNVIFKRERDNYQTLTAENPYLVLTGPVRGVVFCDPVVLEVSLYVRGTTESDDKELNLLAAGLAKVCSHLLNSCLIEESYTSRLSTLVFELGHIVYSVEATISVKVISGPPDGFYGKFVAFTDSLKPKVLLHNSGVEERYLAGDEINLSRSVVSVESSGKLMVSVRASDGSVTLTGTKEFKPLEKGTTTVELHIAELCQLEITVAWSLFTYLGA